MHNVVKCDDYEWRNFATGLGLTDCNSNRERLDSPRHLEIRAGGETLAFCYESINVVITTTL